MEEIFIHYTSEKDYYPRSRWHVKRSKNQTLEYGEKSWRDISQKNIKSKLEYEKKSSPTTRGTQMKMAIREHLTPMTMAYYQ